MRFAKPFGWAVLGMALGLSSVVVTSQVSADSAKAKADKTRADKKSVTVPEPATILLLGAAAGAAGVGKIWQRRRRSRLVSSAVRPPQVRNN
jgi:hypothetical protein